MLEKNNSHNDIAAIEFNWERVKKKASAKKEVLINNAPKVVKRSTSNNTPTEVRANPSIQTTIDTDTVIDPYEHIQSKLSTGTLQPKLLPLAPAGEEITPLDEGELGPEQNAVQLLKGIKNGEIVGKELTVDERRLVVESMQQLGQTQDAIADLLKVSRRTIVSDYKVLRQRQALAIASTETTDIAGEVYSTAKTCIRRALQAGHFKTVSVIMRDMVEVLQSLGVVYRAPKTSAAMQLHGKIPGSNTGYQKYMDGIGEDKNKVIEVLDCMFNAIDNE